MTTYISIQGKETLEKIKSAGQLCPVPQQVPTAPTIAVYYAAPQDTSLYGFPWQIAFIVQSKDDIDEFERQYRQGQKISREYYTMNTETINQLLQP